MSVDGKLDELSEAEYTGGKGVAVVEAAEDNGSSELVLVPTVKVDCGV